MATISPLVYQQREEERAQMEASSDSNKGNHSPEESKLRALTMVDLSDKSLSEAVFGFDLFSGK